MEGTDGLELVDYRLQVAALYQKVRESGASRATWLVWRAGRDQLLASHPQSPVPAAERENFSMPFYDYDPRWRLEVELEATSGPVRGDWQPVGRLRVEHPAVSGSLTLLWLDTYGGGLFLPFRDSTNGGLTYGGGRYLLDTVKGAMLAWAGPSLVLDFNFAYHPSCAHDARWNCPLAPPENRLDGPITAGEQLPRRT